jgi:hypothetical protein
VSVELLEDSSSESKGENDAFCFSIISLGAKQKGFESRDGRGDLSRRQKTREKP